MGTLAVLLRVGRRVKRLRVSADSAETAEAAQLRYVSNGAPGIRRLRSSRGFRYLGPDGTAVRDFETRRRIRALAIPPAWTDVWICPTPTGHIQAVGRDAKGRKQYRYHARWREVRDATKYARMVLFGKQLPRIRERLAKDLARPGLPREKVLATVVRLLETTLIRVGNEEYVRTNRSFGLTTLRTQHVTIEGSTLRFEFRGKGGRRHLVDVADRRLTRIVKQCQELPGHELFQYVDENGERQAIDSADVNAYLREISGEDFTAKDFRTWAGTVFAAMALQGFETFDSETQGKRHVVQVIEAVAKRLGNTPAICRKCYVHPAVIEAYLDGTMAQVFKSRTEQELTGSLATFQPEEATVLAFLRQRLLRQSQA